jgi:hypothetical protein
MRAVPVAVLLDGLDVARIRRYFDEHVDRSGGPDACWPWTGITVTRGYGEIQISMGARGKVRRIGAHRAALYFLGGVDPGDLGALHSCDNPPCCNPRHLRPGTPKDNAGERSQRKRNNHLATLSAQDVLAIRREYAEGVRSGVLAARYGVGPRHIWMVATGRTRDEVPGPVAAPRRPGGLPGHARRQVA